MEDKTDRDTGLRRRLGLTAATLAGVFAFMDNIEEVAEFANFATLLLLASGTVAYLLAKRFLPGAR